MFTAKFQLPGTPLTVTNADVYSGGVGLEQMWGYAVQAIWTGATLTGTIKLQATIDDTDWSDITGTGQAVSGPGSFIWNVESALYDQYRVYFAYTSGSGGITLWTRIKGV